MPCKLFTQLLLIMQNVIFVMPMRNQSKNIPENTFPSGIREGIYIARTSFNGLPNVAEVERSHRDNGHIFILQEKGTTRIEVDFQIHQIQESSVIYIHPNQVHRVLGFENATTCSWIITNENLHPEYLKILETLPPLRALTLPAETFSIIAAMASLCIAFADRAHEKLFEPILRESCNTLVALVASQFLGSAATTSNTARSAVITGAFKTLLESNFAVIKSPADYAERLNITTPYLNECVRTATGHSVSYHIQQRNMLAAKRLLYHSAKSVKEIAGELGYPDQNYFTRLFVKTVGITPLTFRNKNFD